MSKQAEAAQAIYITENYARCDGGNGALGHPVVYLKLDENNQVMCPYCNHKFILKNPKDM